MRFDVSTMVMGSVGKCVIDNRKAYLLSVIVINRLSYR